MLIITQANSYVLEILLNTFSSVLTYNQCSDFDPIFLKKDGKFKVREKVLHEHEGTFIEQTLYFLVMVFLNLGQ